MGASSLRERLAKLQSKTRNTGVSKTEQAKKRQKKSFFQADSAVESENVLERVTNITLPRLHFPNVDLNGKVNKDAIMIIGERMSNAYLFPQIGVGVGVSGLLSQNSKTSRISRQYPKVFIQDQLYALYAGQETQVDFCINELVSMGKLHVLDMNFENFGFTVLVLHDEFDRILDSTFKESDHIMLQNYKDLIFSDNQATQLTSTLLLNSNLNIPKLINFGLICISSSESTPGIYNITLPHLGGLLRVVKNSVKWITETTSKTRERMILDSELREKWFKPYITNKDKMTKKQELFKREYYTTDRVGIVKEKSVVVGPGINIVKFRGIGIDWAISLMIGIGILETFDSPVGLVYKWTGKSL